MSVDIKGIKINKSLKSGSNSIENIQDDKNKSLDHLNNSSEIDKTISNGRSESLKSSKTKTKTNTNTSSVYKL